MCLHLFGNSSVKANVAIWHSASPKPVTLIPAIIVAVFCATLKIK